MNPSDHEWQPHPNPLVRFGNDYARWLCTKCGVVSFKDKKPNGGLKRLYIEAKKLGKITCGEYLASQIHFE